MCLGLQLQHASDSTGGKRAHGKAVEAVTDQAPGGGFLGEYRVCNHERGP